jgi:hypothetical protein
MLLPASHVGQLLLECPGCNNHSALSSEHSCSDDGSWLQKTAVMLIVDLFRGELLLLLASNPLLK